jgi:hypothetical protein
MFTEDLYECRLYAFDTKLKPRKMFGLKLLKRIDEFSWGLCFLTTLAFIFRASISLLIIFIIC